VTLAPVVVCSARAAARQSSAVWMRVPVIARLRGGWG
jgi:hypothetical protein